MASEASPLRGNASGLGETLALVRAAGSEGVASVGDVRRRGDVQRMVDDAVSAFGICPYRCRNDLLYLLKFLRLSDNLNTFHVLAIHDN